MSADSAPLNTDAILAELTEPQREAVMHTDGPLLVLAGAGSGKTRVITRRAAHLAVTVARPWEVLAITFTNKAAGEMRDRITAMGLGREMTVCTFHSLGARLLRRYHERVGLDASFTIFDTDDRRAVIKRAVKACGLDPMHWPAARVEARISQAKNALQSPDEFAEVNAGRWQDRHYAAIYTAFQAKMAEQNGLDFDDLLMRLAIALRDDGELRQKLEQRYRYVLIDEYQDTNHAQYLIAHLLTLDNHNLCATGDPDQSIYGWRGANIANILRFEEDYPEARVVRLEQNYRSSKRILSAASQVIAANLRRKEKTLWTENADGPPVTVAEFDTADEEADHIAQRVADWVADGHSPSDVAVFYRINALSLPVELALGRRGIAYQVARGQAFYGRKEIKDLLAYVRVLINPADETALLRIINTPARGIGKTTVGRLQAEALRSGRRLHDVVRDATVRQGFGRGGIRVARFAELLDTLQLFVNHPPAAALEEVFARSGLHASLVGAQTIDAVPLENVDNLIGEARRYEASEPGASLLGWLEQTSLLGDADTVDESAGKVTLMTLHAAKGLEFERVFIIGLEDDLLPFRRDEESHCDIEEERRLCFVGMTRAKRELTLSHARYRIRRGREQRNVCSPFVDELPVDEVNWVKPDDDGPDAVDYNPAGRLPDDVDRWEVGTLVRHPRYDLGRIDAIYRGHNRTHVAVSFEGGTRENFVLEFADLKRVDYDEVG
ncbi:MAG: ATP-dependent helicase [Phycisphaerae bacterium]